MSRKIPPKNNAFMLTYQGSVIERFMDKRTMEQFHEEYCNARLTTKSNQVPTELERKLATDFKVVIKSGRKKEDVEKLEKKYSLTYKQIYYKARKVALYDFYNS